MKILHLLSGGGIGGIEMLCRDIADLSDEQNEFCFLYSGGVIAEEMEQEKYPVYHFYQVCLLARVLKLFHLVREQQYDVIVVHHEGIGIYTFYLLLSYCFKEVKFIKYLHCSFEKEYFFQGNKIRDKISYSILKNVLKRSHAIVAVSEFVKQSYCREFTFEYEKAEVIYNGIRTSQVAVDKYEIVGEDEPIRMLYIGRLIEVKGVHLLLCAIKKLIESGEKVELDILGDGVMRIEYERLSEQLGLNDKVHFHGYVLNKQPFFSEAKIFVYPSIWQEAFGISIIEAMNQGMICVASNAGGIPEIIHDGQDGFLFQKGDSNELSNALRKAIRCCKGLEYSELAEKSRQRSLQFDIKETVNCLHDLYRKVLEV